MKRTLLFLIASILIPSAIIAQEYLDVYEFDRHDEGLETASPSDLYNNEWYNYGDLVYNYSSSTGDIRIDLFPTPEVVVNFGDFMGNVWKHSVGQVLDPKGWLFAGSHPLINEFMPYRVDSIVFPYRYYRFQDGAPDTLLIQYYDQTKMSFGTAGGASFATVAYDTQDKEGADPIHEITYLLTNADSTTQTVEFLKFPVEIDMPANGKFAVTITYFPGNPYNVGDTIDPTMLNTTVNKINDFVVYEYKDFDRLLDIGTYNHSLDATTPVQNGTSGWVNKYVPGIAWQGFAYQLDIYFMLTYPEYTTVDEVDNSGMIRVYPNPVSDDNLNVTLPPDFKGVADYTLVNTLGQVVLSGKLSGPRQSIDTYGIKAGFYSLNVYMDGKVATEKVKKL